VRRPHEFKIACLQDIRALFPPEWNPFYAGFGNRDTDEVSYRCGTRRNTKQQLCSRLLFTQPTIADACCFVDSQLWPALFVLLSAAGAVRACCHRLQLGVRKLAHVDSHAAA
jgi:hypothetical protein